MKIQVIIILLLISITVFSQASIVINEINYNSSDDFVPNDWVELYNNSDTAIDVSNWVFKDSNDEHQYSIPEGTVIEAGAYLVLAEILADFQAVFPEVTPVIGSFDFGLSGGGELIRLFDDAEGLVDFVEYDDDAPWPLEADGTGPTLELINPNLDNNLAESWNASTAANGTPGAANSTFTTGTSSYKVVRFSIAPNPMNDSATISISDTFSISNGRIEIHTILGKQVVSQSFSTNKVTITKGDLVAGLYFCTIYNNGLLIGSQKLLVE